MTKEPQPNRVRIEKYMPCYGGKIGVAIRTSRNWASQMVEVQFRDKSKCWFMICDVIPLNWMDHATVETLDFGG